MAALRSAARKLLLQPTQAMVLSPAAEGRLVPRLIHTAPAPFGSGALNSFTTKAAAPWRSGGRTNLMQMSQFQILNTRIHTGVPRCSPSPAPGAPAEIRSIQEDPKVQPTAAKPDWDTSKDITDPDDTDALVKRLQDIKSKTEELYELSSGIERHVTGFGYHARFNRKLLWYLSSLVDERTNDPVWRQMRRKRRITNVLKFVAVVMYLFMLVSRNQEEKKTAPVEG